MHNCPALRPLTMCLVIFAFHSSPEYPLIVAANRDEFYHRETAAADFWPQQPSLLAGRDLVQGGTWMGLTREGRFAAITNFRDPAQTGPAPRSRGELTLDYLITGLDPESWLCQIASRAGEYAGFNLLLGDRDTLWYASNSGGAGARSFSMKQLPPGIYGLSNARLDTPWPKVSLGKRRLTEVLDEGYLDHQRLLQVVADRRTAPVEQLRPHGLDQEMDRSLSAQFITAHEYDYGTRSSTTLWLSADGRAHWRELSFNSMGVVTNTREELFQLQFSESQKTGL